MSDLPDPWDELPELDEDELLPPYLRDAGPALRTWGELSYSARQKAWVIRGDPAVCQLAKRLFPGCGGRGRGTARFPAGRRATGDLHWLMLRYPLQIKASDISRWSAALAASRAWAVARERAQMRPSVIEERPGAFLGKLMEFQKSGAGFLKDNPRSLLADEMGLGKTVQALAYLADRGEYPALIVVPPHLVTNWNAEIRRFLRVDGREPVIHAIKGLSPYELPKADIYLIHYLLLRGWKTALPGNSFSCVLFDEIQELRHAGTEKYSAASLLSDSCETVYGLSGTPIYNRGGEIWNVINILDFHALGDYESFTREWCSGYGNDLVTKPEVLGEHLRREGLILRRTKEQVLGELPPKRRLVQTIDFDDAVYAQLMRSAESLVDELRGELTNFDRARIEDMLSQRERQATGIAKAPTRFLSAGIADALATWFEAESCLATRHTNFTGYTGTRTAYAIARLCFDTLMASAPAAVEHCDLGIVTPQLEDVVEACTLMSTVGFESGGLGAAHGFHQGLAELPETHKFMHGEKVAMGILASLFLTQKPAELIDDIYAFHLATRLPVCLADLDITDTSRDHLMIAVKRMNLPVECTHWEPIKYSEEDHLAALIAADARGRRFKTANA